MNENQKPTSIRYIILALTVGVAVLLYLDRNCVGFVIQYIRQNLRLTEADANFLLGSFYITYAIGQIPGGWLSDRFGTRLTLALYLGIWSALTGLMGFVNGFYLLVAFRLGCGLFEAGAYPACAGLIRRWIPFERRGLASGFISIGGRLGGTVTPIATAYLMVLFMPVSTPSEVSESDLRDPHELARAVMDDKNHQQFTTRLQALLPKHALGIMQQIAEQPADQPLSDEQRETITSAVNIWLKNPSWTDGIDLAPLLLKLNPPDRKLFDPTSSPRSESEITRRNRLLLELLFPDRIRRIYGDSWQPVLMVYGVIGVFVAFFFWGFYRDSPRQHFLANEAEAKLVEAHETATETKLPPMSTGALWRGILTSRGLWASSIVQFGTNFGWVFLVTMLPTYLQRVHEVPEVTRGWMVFWPSCLSLPMLIVGGWWTDWMTKKFGPYLGRSFPIASTRFLAAGAYLLCYLLDAPWPVTIALCVFSVTNDIGIPAIWAYNLDVGKKNVGLILGWGNMWGNLGAFVSPLLLGYVLKSFVDFDGHYTVAEANAGYKAVFLTCAGVFVLMGILSFFIDATKPIGENNEA